mmetsp:Transcript_20801/g.65403  ORF Transcript_20801/g.65403 Transcript_20801/m.65403 type:complete len:259 (+) Transcript_20801:371-1147(+)
MPRRQTVCPARERRRAGSRLLRRRRPAHLALKPVPGDARRLGTLRELLCSEQPSRNGVVPRGELDRAAGLLALHAPQNRRLPARRLRRGVRLRRLLVADRPRFARRAPRPGLRIFSLLQPDHPLPHCGLHPRRLRLRPLLKTAPGHARDARRRPPVHLPRRPRQARRQTPSLLPPPHPPSHQGRGPLPPSPGLNPLTSPTAQLLPPARRPSRRLATNWSPCSVVHRGLATAGLANPERRPFTRTSPSALYSFYSIILC